LTWAEKKLKNVKNQAEVDLAQSKITQILSYTKLPSSNLSNDEMKALKELRLDNSIRIMKADKGTSR